MISRFASFHFDSPIAIVSFMTVWGFRWTLRLLTLCLMGLIAFPSMAKAEISAQVVQLGFDNYYRPGQWVPVKIRVSSPTAQYELRISQRDDDGDRLLFSRRIVVTGSGQTGDAQSGPRQQELWAYLLPESIEGGLPDDDEALTQRLRITLHTTDGVEVQQVRPNRQLPRSLDPSLTGQAMRGARLILLVNGIGTNTRVFSAPNLVGVLEDYLFVNVRPEQLPQSPAGLDMVDAVVWCNSTPPEISQDPQRLASIREWVKKGGHLLIATPTQWQQLEEFGDMLPVAISNVDALGKTSLEELPQLERFFQGSSIDIAEVFSSLRVARSLPRPSAVADLVVDSKDQQSVPLLVRMPYGYGCVSWAAFDFGDRLLSQDAELWAKLWPRLLGYNDVALLKPDINGLPAPQTPTPNPALRSGQTFGPPSGQPAVQALAPRLPRIFAEVDGGNSRDLGASLPRGMSQPGTAAALIGITALFFIGYWLLAGPGLFIALRYKNLSTWNWIGFAAIASAATLLTLGVVRVVLSGAPTIAHTSIVRIQPVVTASAALATAKMPTLVRSRVGLYVRRNAPQAVSLAASDGTISSLMLPYAQHPIFRDSGEVAVAAPRDYVIEMPTEPASQHTEISPYFRTTLKRFDFNWAGNAIATPDNEAAQSTIQVSSQSGPPGTPMGAPSLAGNRMGEIDGGLQNLSGTDLVNVYFVYSVPIAGSWEDFLYYVPRWPKDAVLDLRKTLNPPSSEPGSFDVAADRRPMISGSVLRGMYDQRIARDPQRGWPSAWIGNDFRRSSIAESPAYDDYGSATPTSVPMLSFFSRLPPVYNTEVGNSGAVNRVELRRSGARDVDISNAILAGNRVIVAQDAKDAPIPAPMLVEGQKPSGLGRVIYQFVLPLDRSRIKTPPRPTTNSVETISKPAKTSP